MIKTMKALAGVNIRQCERTVHAVEEYNRTVEMGLQVALERLGPQAVPSYVPGQKLGAIIFGSDQGMCGLLNDQVLNLRPMHCADWQRGASSRKFFRWECAPPRNSGAWCAR